MPSFICETCGTQYAETTLSPSHCPVCEDERQYVGWKGQTWTTHEALAARYRLRLEDDEPVGDPRAVVPVDIGNPCWIWKDVDLTGVTSLRVDAVDLPFNFQFGADPAPGALRKQATREGDGPLLDHCMIVQESGDSWVAAALTPQICQTYPRSPA